MYLQKSADPHYGKKWPSDLVDLRFVQAQPSFDVLWQNSPKYDSPADFSPEESG